MRMPMSMMWSNEVGYYSITFPLLVLFFHSLDKKDQTEVGALFYKGFIIAFRKWPPLFLGALNIPGQHYMLFAQLRQGLVGCAAGHQVTEELAIRLGEAPLGAGFMNLT